MPNAASPTISGNESTGNIVALPRREMSTDLIQRIEQANHDARDTRAAQTIRTYKAGVDSFVAWCDETGRDFGLPVAPADLAAFVDARSETLKPATVDKYVTGVNAMHFDMDWSEPAKTRIVRQALQRMRRTKGTAQKQATPLCIDAIIPAIAALGDTPADLRDAALIWLAYDSMARASEIVALNVSDLKTLGDDASIFIARSKNDQEGKGQQRYVSEQTLDALIAWIDAAGLEQDAPLFKPVANSGKSDRITAQDVTRIFKRRIGKQYTAHSTRIGAAIDQLQARETTARIMQAGGWKSPVMVARYTMQADTANSAAAGLARKQGRSRIVKR